MTQTNKPPNIVEKTQEIVVTKDVTLSLDKAADDFNKFAESTGLIWTNERFFAASMLIESAGNNDYLANIAKTNPFSLTTAVAQVAAIGLTLNPAEGLCFLVPRDGAIKLDISYQGLKTIATDQGILDRCHVDLVYKEDKFIFNGKSQEPLHSYDPFSKHRGELVGGYCVAVLQDGSIMVEPVTVIDINKAKDSSKAANGPWMTWYEEMAKKMIIKRSFKNWPKRKGNKVMAEAIHIINEHEGLELPKEVEQSGNAVVIDSYDVKQISPLIITKVEEVVRRAANANAWLAAEDYMGETFANEDLLFAYDKLREAKANIPPALDTSIKAPQPIT